jgi:type IV secretory pathway VirB10-like protein
VQCAGNLRNAHAEGGDELRRATGTYRDIMRDVAAAARDDGPGGRPLSDELTDRVRSTLLAAAADPELAAEIRAGRLTAERTGAVVPDIAPPPRPAATAAPADPADDTADRERAKRRDALRRRLDAAVERRDAARTAAEEANAAAEAARTAADRARADLQDAEDDVEELTSELEELGEP